MFGNFMNEALNKGMRIIIQHYIKSYGEVTALSIDDSTKEIKATLLLKGELQTLDVRIIGYNFIKIDGKGYMTFLKISTSREWLNLVLQDHPPKELKERKVEIPPAAAIILKFVF